MTEIGEQNRVFEATGKESFLDVVQHVLDDEVIDIGVVRQAASAEECQAMLDVYKDVRNDKPEIAKAWYQAFPNQTDVDAHVQQWWVNEGLGNVAIKPFMSDGITHPGNGLDAHLDNDVPKNDVVLRYGALDYSLDLTGQAFFCSEKLTVPATQNRHAYIRALYEHVVAMSRMPAHRLRSGVAVEPGDLVIIADLPHPTMHGVITRDDQRQACLGGHRISRIDPMLPFTLPVAWAD